MPKPTGSAAAEGLPDTRIDALKDLEFDLHALVCMAQIMETMLEEMTSTNGPGFISGDENQTKFRITTFDLDLASFAFHDVVTKAERLKKKFMTALYPVEVKS